MKIFIFKSAIFISIIILSCFLIRSLNQFFPPSKNDYLAAMIDKHARLKSLAPPRIILVGGSSLAFGINSEEIESQTGLPVINMGLHAGLGLQNILNEMRGEIKQGDIVILSIEYSTKKGEPDLIEKAIALYPQANVFLSNPAAKKIFGKRGYLNYMISQVQGPADKFVINLFDRIKNKMADQIYKRDGFNKYGDVISHLREKNKEFLDGRAVHQRSDYNEYIDMMNDFARYVRSEKGSIYFLYPPYPLSEYQNNKEWIGYYVEQYNKGLTMEILNDHKDAIYPDSLFFNTIFHLNAKGREFRTNDLVKRLKEKLMIR
jgi:hypothetical protein